MALGRSPHMRQVKMPQNAVEIGLDTVNACEIWLIEGKLYKGVVNEVFGQLLIILRQG